MEKIAVIDLGSNNVKMVSAYVLESEHFVIFDQLKENVRLGYEVSSDGFLKQSRVQQAVSALKMFKKMCDSHDIDKVYAVATSAVRRAKNQKSFLEEIYSTCGFKLKVITESDEANHIYNGVVNGFDIQKGLIIDISGSSLQLIRFNRKGIVNRESLRFGSITLLEKFDNQKMSPQEIAGGIEQFVKEELQKIEWLKQLEHDTVFVGVGTAFRSLAKISSRLRRYPLNYVHNYVVDNTDFNNIYGMVKVLDADKRTKIKGMSGRADTFCTAMSSLKAIVDYANISSLVISENGLREGVMFNHATPSTTEKPISDVLGHSIYSKLNFLNENIKHCEQVFALVVQLYKQLRVLHKLPRFYNKVLRIATLMHECGSLINNSNFSNHSFYYILNCGLQGASHREIVLAGFVVTAYKQDEISKSEWQKYKSIVMEEDLIAVYKLAVILRIADSLDRSMSNGITSISCDILGDSVIMKTTQVGDCSLEVTDAHKTADEHFAKAFRKNLKIL